MKKTLIGLIIVIFAISCGMKPEQVVSKFLDNVKEKKLEEAGKYVLGDEKESLALEYNNTAQQLLFDKLFSNLNYKITNVEEKDKDNIVVTVEIENIDTKKVFLNIFNKMFQRTFSAKNEQVSIEEEFKSILESNEVPKATNETKFFIVKTKRGKKIDLTSENIDMMFGKLNTTLSNLNSLGQEEHIEDEHLKEDTK